MDYFCEMSHSDALVSTLQKARHWLYTGGKHETFSKVNLSPSSLYALFGFLQEVQQANIGVTVL